MKLRQLGQDGPLVSAVGYGAMSFTDFYGPADNYSSAKVLDACLEKGISHLDTADAYGMGRSETVIGDWLKARGGTCPFTLFSIAPTIDAMSLWYSRIDTIVL